MYEFNIVRMKALRTERRIILIVILEAIANNTLPIDVLDMISTYTYLEYPKDQSKNDLDVFWSKCADFISEI